MRRINLPRPTIFALLALGAVVPYARATAITYTNSSSFDAATSALSTQTFTGVASDVGVGPGGNASVSNPLDSSTNGGMLPGLTINATPDVPYGIAVLGPDYLGSDLTNYSVFGSYLGSGLDFTLGPAMTAASLDLLTLNGSANVDITVFDPSDVSLGNFIVTGVPSSGSGVFWGITVSGDTIGSIDITVPSEHFVGIDQVQFGSAAAVTPEPSSLWLLGSGLLGLLGAAGRKAKV